MGIFKLARNLDVHLIVIEVVVVKHIQIFTEHRELLLASLELRITDFFVKLLKLWNESIHILPLQSILLVPGDDLLVSAAEIHGDLGPLEPMLERALRFHVSNVGLERLLLDSECLQNAKHLFHSIVDLAYLVAFDSTIGSDVLCLLDLAHLLDLRRVALLHHRLRHDELLKHLLLSVFTPA